MKKYVSSLNQIAMVAISDEGMHSEMRRRQIQIREACHKYASAKQKLQTRKSLTYQAKETKWSQEIHPSSFIVEPRSRSIFCINRKVASSRWQLLFNQIHSDEPYISGLLQSGQNYK